MAIAILTRFAARHGVDAADVFSGPLGVVQMGRLQNELSHYQRGWDAFAGAHPSEKAAFAAANAAYEKMTRWNASLGAVSQQEYVAGYVDAWQEFGEPESA